MWVAGSCNTYTTELLGAEAIEVDDDPEPDDDPTPDPGPSGTGTPPEPDPCPAPPCEDEPSDDDTPSDDDVPEPTAPSVPTEPPTTTEPAPDPAPEPSATGGAGGSQPGPEPTMPSGTGGTPSLGGSAGVGGSIPGPGPGPVGGSPPVVVPPSLDVKLIEDFEDQNVTILRNDGRTGFWFVDGDPTGDPAGTISPFEAALVDPANAGLPNSTRALHVVASGYAATGWALAGVDFNGGDPYEKAANYSGITFWGRAGGTESAVFAFRIPTLATDTDDDHYGGDVTLSDEWVPYLIPFEGTFLSQQGFGEEVPFEPAEIIGIQFALSPGQTGFDIWIDDVEFAELPEQPSE